MIFIKKTNYYLRKYFILLIIFIITSFLLKNKIISTFIFDDYFDYSYFRSKTNYLLGIFRNKSSFVSSDKLEYKNVSKYNNSYKFITDKYYVIKNLKSGLVVYIGNKDNLGNTIIINGDNGINYWYSNLDNISVSLYDYVDINTVIGSVKDNYFYLTLMKDKEYLNYEEYI